MMDDIRALTSDAECSWEYIDRLKRAHSMACQERDVITKRMIQLEIEMAKVQKERDAAVKCLDEIREAAGEINKTINASLFSRENACNSASKRFSDGSEIQVGRLEKNEKFKRPSWWSTEPDVGRVAYGVPDRVDRLRCLGNAVVPQRFYPFFKAIAEIEEGQHG